MIRQLYVAAATWAGLGLAGGLGSMVYKGSMQVLGNVEAADSKALAGISGMGHIVLTVAMILLFMGLKEVPATRTPAAERLPAAADAWPRPSADAG